MSRDDLAPDAFARVSDRFDTPTVAIGLTGLVTVVLILGVPIMEIAKLGSAFKILVFVLINAALVTFRESDVPDYDPEFTDPLYPYSQAFGIVAGLVLLTQMGLVPALGAVLILVVGVLWYALYARDRVDREGVALGEIRRRVGRRAVERTRSTFEESDEYEVVVAVTEQTSPGEEESLTEVAASVADQRDGSVTVVRFETVPDQLPLPSATRIETPEDAAFEARMAAFDAATDVPTEYGEVVSHDARHAVVNFADHHDADLLVVGEGAGGLWSRLFGDDTDWVVRHTPCDVLLVDAEGLAESGEVALVADDGPFEPVKVEVADALAAATGASLTLVQGLPPDATPERRVTVREYHDDIVDLCSVPVDSRVVETRDAIDLAASVDDADLVVVQTSGSAATARRRARLLEAVDEPTIVVRPATDDQTGRLGRLFERLTF